MKQPYLGKKKRFVNGFYIFVIVFLIIWMCGFFLFGEPEALSFGESMFFAVPGVLILVVGLSLYVFFNRQTVSISEDEDRLSICFYNTGNIDCVAFPVFQKSLPCESEREARITFPEETFL
ncbi:hypothetical protein [Hominibacterium faecale]|uniref:hypothetical protein n=1 Tax=Hominibacterium faecale TaxID=2839743 RepID=UPI0022B2A38D|nr:hypothetical protein [Hominibacterium faecale]